MSVGCWSHYVKLKEGAGGDCQPYAKVYVRLVIMVTMESTGCYLPQQLPPTPSYFQPAVYILQTHCLLSSTSVT